ncbi:MAG: NAD(P)H-dependent oxidoreductase [Bacteroidota bacterium]|nr:NAD(P)H-dependent oxidoreductase [Bacteroidota bacterium]
MKTKKIAVFVGSLRKESFNRKMALTLMSLAPESFEFELLEIGGLPFFNEDLEVSPPAEWTAFRKRLSAFDGVLFVTPEYNRSVPAVLKNALDVASRPYGKNCWNGKPGAIVSVSLGTIGGFGANHHLRQMLTFLNVPTMQQPEAYIGNVSELFNEKGELVNEPTRNYLIGFMASFENWIMRNVE